MLGLPDGGGSSRPRGPDGWVGIAIVVAATLLVVGGLLFALFRAVDLIR
jgi:hypothetical protein